MAPVVKKTWAPKGETPKIKHKTRSHKKISAIGAIAVRHNGSRPRMMFRLLEGQNANSQIFVQFLTQLLQNIDGHVIVIWDRLVAHRSKVVNRWLEKNSRIETEFFPPYAPVSDFVMRSHPISPIGATGASATCCLFEQA